MGKQGKSPQKSQAKTPTGTRQSSRIAAKKEESHGFNESGDHEMDTVPSSQEVAAKSSKTKSESPANTPSKKTKGKTQYEERNVDLPEGYQSVNHKALTNLVISINSYNKKILQNLDVKTNFKDLQEIIEGLTGPVQTPTGSEKKRKKRRHSIVHHETDLENAEKTNIDDLQGTLEKIQAENEELKKEQSRLKTENEKFAKEKDKQTKLSTDITEKLRKSESKLEEATLEKEQLQQQSMKFSNEISIFQTKLTEIENTLKKKETDIQTKNEELEILSKDVIAGREHLADKIRATDEMKSKLGKKDTEIDELKSKLGKKSTEIDELRNRLSVMSASKLDGDPSLTDLGDPNRPLKLVERFQQLYDNLWTDVFDELNDSYENVEDDNEKERMAALEILSIFEKVQKFCANTSEDQERSITAKLMLSSQENEECTIDRSAIRNIRKSHGERVVPSLIQLYTNQTENNSTKCMKEFVDECLSLCWLAQIQDPPLTFDFDFPHDSPFDKDLMKEFTISGDKVDYVVWPTLRLHKNGPVMVKSVVQPIRKQR